MRKTVVIKILLTMVVILYNPSAKLLTLGEAEHKAVTVGFDARIQHFEEQAKKWEKRNVISGYLPKIDYSMNFMRLGDKVINESNKAFEGFDGIFDLLNIDPSEEPESKYASPMTQYKNSLKHEFTINQPITNGGVEVFAIQIAKETQKAIALQKRVLEQDIIYSVRKAYFDILAASERTNVAKHDLSWTKANYKKAKLKYEQGTTPITDVLQWESEVAKKESDLIQSQATEDYMKHSLYQIMGYSEYSISTFNLQPFEVFEKKYQKGEIETNDAIENNLQLQSVMQYTKIAAGYKKIAISSFLPKINAFLSTSFEQVFNDTDEIFKNIRVKNKPPSLAFGAVLSVPLFSGFKNSTKYRKTQFEYNKVQVEEQKVKTQLQVNLERIKLFYHASHETVKASLKQQKLMQRQLDIMQQRYDGGLVNQSQLLEVSLGLKMTKIEYVQKLFDCLLYEAEYLKNVGKLEVSK